MKFFHNEVKINQNNIYDSIYVTESGDWKLSGFHKTAPFRSPGPDHYALSEVVWSIFNGFNDVPSNLTLTNIPRRLQGLFKKLVSKTKPNTAADLLLGILIFINKNR